MQFVEDEDEEDDVEAASQIRDVLKGNVIEAILLLHVKRSVADSRRSEMPCLQQQSNSGSLLAASQIRDVLKCHAYNSSRIAGRCLQRRRFATF